MQMLTQMQTQEVTGGAVSFTLAQQPAILAPSVKRPAPYTTTANGASAAYTPTMGGVADDSI